MTSLLPTTPSCKDLDYFFAISVGDFVARPEGLLLRFPRGARSRHVAPEANDATLARRCHQRAIFSEHMHQTMTKAAFNHVNANIKQYPFGRNQLADAQCVVEAVSATTNA